MYKKILAGVLAVTLTAGGLGLPTDVIGNVTEITSISADAATSGDYTYRVLSSGNVEITGYKGSETELTVPAKINGKKVTSIGDSAFKGSKIETIFFKCALKTIGKSAFEGCKKLETVSFDKNSLSEIKARAFYGCTELYYFYFYDSNIETIGDYAFYGTALSGFSMPSKSLGKYAFCIRDAVGLISSTASNNATIGEKAIGYYINSSGKVVKNSDFKFYLYKANTSLLTYVKNNGFTNIVYEQSYSEIINELKKNNAYYILGKNSDGNTDILAFSAYKDKYYVKKSGDFLYYDMGSYAAVCGYVGKKTKIVLPEKINKLPVKAVAGLSAYEEWFADDGTSIGGGGGEIIMQFGYNALFNSKLKSGINLTVTLPSTCTKVLADSMQGYTTDVKFRCTHGAAARFFKKYSMPYAIYKHNYKTKKVVKASGKLPGYTLKVCKTCGNVAYTDYTSDAISLSKCTVSTPKNSVYTGKAIKPAITVKYGSATLTNGSDYTVTYTNNIKTGKAKVTIKGKGRLKGTVTKYFNIVPKQQTVTSLTSPKTSQIKVVWTKDSMATAYEVNISSKRDFSTQKTYTVSTKYKSKTIGSLTSGKVYYVRVRSYKSISGKRVYGKYSVLQKVTCQ
jgi:hypothetical protein